MSGTPTRPPGLHPPSTNTTNTNTTNSPNAFGLSAGTGTGTGANTNSTYGARALSPFRTFARNSSTSVSSWISSLAAAHANAASAGAGGSSNGGGPMTSTPKARTTPMPAPIPVPPLPAGVGRAGTARTETTTTTRGPQTRKALQGVGVASSAGSGTGTGTGTSSGSSPPPIPGEFKTRVGSPLGSIPTMKISGGSSASDHSDHHHQPQPHPQPQERVQEEDEHPLSRRNEKGYESVLKLTVPDLQTDVDDTVGKEAAAGSGAGGNTSGGKQATSWYMRRRRDDDDDDEDGEDEEHEGDRSHDHGKALSELNFIPADIPLIPTEPGSLGSGSLSPTSYSQQQGVPGTSPTTGGDIGRGGLSSSRRSKAKSFVGGFVTGIRGIPRAVTHSSVYDRRCSSSKFSTSYTASYYSESRMVYPVPVVFAHPGAAAGAAQGLPPGVFPMLPPGIPFNPAMGIPFHGHHPHPDGTGSTILSGYTETKFHGGEGHHRGGGIAGSSSSYMTNGTGHSISSRLGEFFGELSNMPWISPGRVAVDYVPGESTRALARSKSNGASWYSINPPATPSDITAPWKLMPDPWFPPTATRTHLPPTQEVDEREGEDGDEDGRESAAGLLASAGAIAGADGDVKGEAEEIAMEKLRSVREELEEKTRELDGMRQVVEHQKKHISALEGDIGELRQQTETQSELRRLRSSARKSLTGYRKRDSVRTVTSMRRASLSRPASTFYEE